MRRAFLAGLLGLALAACATPSGPQRYSGTYDWHFETSSFVTDGGQGPYWLAAEGVNHERLVAPIQNTGAGPWGRVHVVVEGVLSRPGSYGHLGAYSNELRVTRVIETRLISTDRAPQGS